MSSWTCHAVPARTGRRCGHLNEGEPLMKRVFGEKPIEFCQDCGCTRHASDLREARDKAPQPKLYPLPAANSPEWN
jgi:hypothetical protein